MKLLTYKELLALRYIVETAFECGVECGKDGISFQDSFGNEWEEIYLREHDDIHSREGFTERDAFDEYYGDGA